MGFLKYIQTAIERLVVTSKRDYSYHLISFLGVYITCSLFTCVFVLGLTLTWRNHQPMSMSASMRRLAATLGFCTNCCAEVRTLTDVPRHLGCRWFEKIRNMWQQTKWNQDIGHEFSISKSIVNSLGEMWDFHLHNWFREPWCNDISKQLFRETL